MMFEKEIERLKDLLNCLEKEKSFESKVEILNKEPVVIKYLEEFLEFNRFVSYQNSKNQFLIKSLLAINQGPAIFVHFTDSLRSSLDELLIVLDEIEQFYHSIGGLIGYHQLTLKLIHEKKYGTQDDEKARYSKPPGINVSEDQQITALYVRHGIEHFSELGIIYPVGGAGDRLSLCDEESGEPMPAAQLLFCGRTLLEGLIRDLQAREYLHYKLTGKQLLTPIAMMTSHEKHNDEHIKAICEKNHWFGRGKEAFRFFVQPLVPVMTIQGDWICTSPLKLMLKPGGHGAIWKLAKDQGIFEWFEKQGRKKALIRQINNPIAGLDQLLLAFCGIGLSLDKTFGFASCERRLNSSEGMITLIERVKNKHKYYSISNIEYTEFEKKDIQDIPEKADSPFSVFPANTNILFLDLTEIEKVIKKHPFPGMLINMKNFVPVIGENGLLESVESGRLESTMQNVADCLEYDSLENLKTFVTYSLRHKTISVTKKSYRCGESIYETPEGCFYELMLNMKELLEEYCAFKLPKMPSLNDYESEKPPFIVHIHPALGPMFSIIGQKIHHGEMAIGSELILEIAELSLFGLNLAGSLVIQAEAVMGQSTHHLLQFGNHTGKCELKNVSIKNRGLDSHQETPYWKNHLTHQEQMKIILKGNSEFFAENICFEGNFLIEVPDGYRYTAYQDQHGVKFKKEFIQEPTWHWEYLFDEKNDVKIQKKI